MRNKVQKSPIQAEVIRRLDGLEAPEAAYRLGTSRQTISRIRNYDRGLGPVLLRKVLRIWPDMLYLLNDHKPETNGRDAA